MTALEELTDRVIYQWQSEDQLRQFKTQLALRLEDGTSGIDFRDGGRDAPDDEDLCGGILPEPGLYQTVLHHAPVEDV